MLTAEDAPWGEPDRAIRRAVEQEWGCTFDAARADWLGAEHELRQIEAHGIGGDARNGIVRHARASLLRYVLMLGEAAFYMRDSHRRLGISDYLREVPIGAAYGMEVDVAVETLDLALDYAVGPKPQLQDTQRAIVVLADWALNHHKPRRRGRK